MVDRASSGRQVPERIGRWPVVGVLGRGGMGVVFEARDPESDRPLAIKVLRAASASSAALLRFKREAELLARVRHAGVVCVHALETLDDGSLALVMDKVDGEELGALRARGPLEARASAALVARLARAVGALHRGGVLHRDLKPQNVLVRADGSPVLIDFGLARADDRSRLTESGALLGTPAFMAPEQVRSEPLDERTDVHGLGAVLFHLVTGRAPFDAGSVPATLEAVLNRAPDWPAVDGRAVTSDLLEVLRRALAKAPADRYPDAHALANDLERVERGEPVGVRRGPGAALLLGACGLCALGLGLGLALRPGEPPAALPSPVAVVESARPAAPTTARAPVEPPRPVRSARDLLERAATAEAAERPRLRRELQVWLQAAGAARGESAEVARAIEGLPLLVLGAELQGSREGGARAEFLADGDLLVAARGALRRYRLPGPEAEPAGVVEGEWPIDALPRDVSAGPARDRPLVLLDHGRILDGEGRPWATVEGDARALARSPSGDHVAVLRAPERGGPPRAVLLLDRAGAQVGEVPTPFPGDSVVFAGDDLLLVGESDPVGELDEVCAWSLSEARFVATRKVEGRPIALAVSGDARQLAVGTTHAHLHLELLVREAGADAGDASRLLVLGGAGLLDSTRVLDAPPSSRAPRLSGVRFSPGASALHAVTGIHDEHGASELVDWDITAAAPLGAVRRLSAEATGAIDVSPDGELLAVGLRSGLVEVWPARRAASASVLLPGHPAGRETHGVWLEGRVLTAAEDEVLRVWVAQGERWREDSFMSRPADTELMAPLERGALIACGAVVLRADAHGLVRPVARLPGDVGSLTVHPSGALAVAVVHVPDGAVTRGVWLLDLEGGAAPRLLDTGDAPPRSAAYLPDGSLVVGLGHVPGAAGGELRVLSPAGELRARRALPDPAHRIAASPDGRTVVVGLRNCSLLLVDLASDAEPRALHDAAAALGGFSLPHLACVDGLAFDRAGGLMSAAPAYRDGKPVGLEVLRWDVSSGRRTGRVELLGDFEPEALHLGPDGRSVLVATDGGRVHLVRVE